MLGDSTAECRRQAADSLGGFGQNALPVLWRALRAPDESRKEAARELAVRLGPLAVEGLLVLAREESVERELVVDCLREIGGPSAVFGLAELGLAATGAQPSL